MLQKSYQRRIWAIFRNWIRALASISECTTNNARNDERERRRCARARMHVRVRDGVSFTNGKATATFSRTFYTCGFHSPLRPCDWFDLYESVVWLNARNESRSNRRWSWHRVARPRPRERDSDAEKETSRFIMFREKILREQTCNISKCKRLKILLGEIERGERKENADKSLKIPNSINCSA